VSARLAVVVIQMHVNDAGPEDAEGLLEAALEIRMSGIQRDLQGRIPDLRHPLHQIFIPRLEAIRNVAVILQSEQDTRALRPDRSVVEGFLETHERLRTQIGKLVFRILRQGMFLVDAHPRLLSGMDHDDTAVDLAAEFDGLAQFPPALGQMEFVHICEVVPTGKMNGVGEALLPAEAAHGLLVLFRGAVGREDVGRRVDFHTLESPVRRKPNRVERRHLQKQRIRGYSYARHEALLKVKTPASARLAPEERPALRTAASLKPKRRSSRRPTIPAPRVPGVRRSSVRRR